MASALMRETCSWQQRVQNAVIVISSPIMIIMKSNFLFMKTSTSLGNLKKSYSEPLASCISCHFCCSVYSSIYKWCIIEACCWNNAIYFGWCFTEFIGQTIRNRFFSQLITVYCLIPCIFLPWTREWTCYKWCACKMRPSHDWLWFD